MSLLLEALRRAEEEAKKSKLTDARVSTPAALSAASQPTAKHDGPAPIAAMTHRQAMSAAGVMAGSQQRKTAGAEQRRKWWPVAVAFVTVLSVAAVLLFGDSFVSSVRMLLAATAPVAPLTPATMPISLPASLPDVATADNAPLPVSVELPRPVGRRTLHPRTAVAAASSELTDKLAGDGVSDANTSSAAAPTAPSLSLTASVAKPDSLMASAYAAYQAGNPAEASRLYREVLKADATQRDAWLGLAVIAHADNQREPALDAYKRVLRLEPQNATALAGINSLSSHAGEPQQESRLRELLARSPDDPDLNHALGLVLSGAQRWSEAQPLFFKAHQLAPQVPRFAYNLAVIFDHLRRSSLAIQYYESSLLLAQDRDAGFDESSARSRLAVLRTAAAQRSTP